MPWDVLLSTDNSLARLTAQPSELDDHDHGLQFDRWSYESTEPIDLDALRELVRTRLPGDVYRMKGFVHAADDPDHRYIVHTVGRRSEIRRDDVWGDAAPLRRLVAIGAAGRLDGDWLRREVGDCGDLTTVP